MSEIENAAAAAWSPQDILGSELLTKEGLKPTNTVLAGKKLIGLYFASSWNPTSGGFSPELIKMYELIKEQDPSILEIVLISFEKSQEDFDKYAASFPWVSLPYKPEAFGDVRKIMESFNTTGLASFRVLDSSGNVRDDNGRATVVKAKGYWRQPRGHPDGKKAPWSAPTIPELALKKWLPENYPDVKPGKK